MKSRQIATKNRDENRCDLSRFLQEIVAICRDFKIVAISSIFEFQIQI